MNARPTLRPAAACFLFVAAAPALAGPQSPLTAEKAIEIQQDGVREAAGTAPCPRDANGEDIIICGRRGPDPNRLPLPVEPEPGEREHLLPGELPRAQVSYNTCMIACSRPVTINDGDIVKYGGRLIRHILGKDD